MPAFLTLGGYDKQGTEFYDSKRYPMMTALRINGSFHWQFKAGKMAFGQKSFILSQQFVLTDTGTSLIIMPASDWDNLFDAICSQISDLFEDVQCGYEDIKVI